MTYLRLGVRNIIGGAGGAKWHANGGIFIQALEDGPMDTPAAVRKLAVAWVGEERSDRLCKAWRLSDNSDREWPMPAHSGHAFFVEPLLMEGPIVPDLSRLGSSDLDYFLTPVILDQQKMKSHQGGVWRWLHYRDAVKRYAIGQLENVVMPSDRQALEILDGLLTDSSATAEQRECLDVQHREIGIHLCYMERVRNWFQASYYCSVGAAPYLGIPTLPEIIDREIAASQRWHELDGGIGELDDDRQRLMRAHRADAPNPIDLREFPYRDYPGLNHWPGAHLVESK